jgi:phage-related protein/predicted XRE-type DNA-binding protein
MSDEPPLKPVIWVGASLKDLREFPSPVQDQMGYALYLAQRGGKHQNVKVLSGFGGAGVVEVIKDYRGDTFRAVYTLKYAGTVFVLHAFEERTANAAPGHRVDSAAAARGRADRTRGKTMNHKRRYETGSGNVFKDIGVPNAEEHLIKAQLVFKIDAILKKRGLKQVEAADLFGVRQPDVSKMLRGDFRQFSVERLLRFLVALDQDVEIVVKPHRSRSEAAAMQVV